MAAGATGQYLPESKKPLRERCSIALCSGDRAVPARRKEVSVGELAAKLALDKSVTNRRLTGRQPGDPPRSARPDRPWRSDAGMVKLLPEPGELDA